LRLSSVLPIIPAGKAAATSASPPSKNLNNLSACSFSLSAVSANIPEICS